MSAAAEYVGLKDFAGWRFTLVPQANEAGSPGFLLHHLAPSDNAIGWAQQEPANRQQPSVAEKLEWVHARPDEWREDAWLRQWLRHGLIREVAA